MAANSKVLILTAGFGDGHNSAARSIAEAIELQSAGKVSTVVSDLFEDAAPITGGFYKNCYRGMINHCPALWAWLFKQSGKGNFRALWWDRFVGVGPALARRLEELRPEVVVITYPIFPYFLEQMPAGVFRPRRVFMAVTDSISIHPIWLQSHVDRLFVTDDHSAGICGQARGAEGIRVSGFPVSPVFSQLPARPAEAQAGKLRILYFATTAAAHVRATLRSLLDHWPEGAELTLVMGRHLARLKPVVSEILQEFPAVSVRCLGWCREVPLLLMSHDLVISKAGGATVHECFAAGVPVMVNYIIPGQEEGNAELLERLGCGCRCLDPAESGPLLAALTGSGGLSRMQAAMAIHRRPGGAVTIADEVLECLRPGGK